MANSWGIYDRNPQHTTLGYFPCAPGCRASLSDPRTCQCVCQGINHGILVYPRPERPIPVPYGFNPSLPLDQLPESAYLPEERKRLPHLGAPFEKPEKPRDTRPFRERHTVASKIGRSLKTSIAGYSTDDLNLMVLDGLRKQFSQERADSFVTEAFSEFFSHQPDANTPELYELYENGDIDRVLDRRSIRWVIGRPKIKRGR